MFLKRVATPGALILALCSCAFGQLNQNCTVSVLNRNVQVNADGSWVLPNVPANVGQVKARATCVQNGVTTSGESDFFTVPANAAVNLPVITLGSSSQIPVSLAISPTAPALTAAGQTVQLVVTATYPDSSTKNITTSVLGTNYTTSNSEIATVSADGLVTAVASGTIVIQATNDGAASITTTSVAIGGATTGGLPISWILANHLDPNDPALPFEDPDRDGLTNLQEFQTGTDPNNPDTDGDGLIDGDEVNKYRTNPLLADTDGDGIPDGVEIQTGSNPLDKNSYDLSKAVSQFTVSPTSFTLTVNTVSQIASQQLTVTGKLIDGKTTLDLTSTSRRTNYNSNNLAVCSFGSPDGRVFAGSNGSCTITITNSGFSATSTGTISSFSPVQVSMLNVAGSVAVDVGGGFAYVAVGTSGITIVDVNDRSNPRLRGSLSGLGNAQSIRVAGSNVLVGDTNGFLRVVGVANPDAPTLIASLAIPGAPNSLAVHSTMAAVAAQSGGVTFVNIATPTAPSIIATLTTPASALGVDFDLQRGLAAIAMGGGGLQVVDISTPISPRFRGLLSGGNVQRVLLRLPAALLADTSRSFSSADLTNPDAPVLASSVAANLGGTPVDLAASDNIAITADTSFGRAVPIINVSNPLLPASVGFWTISPPGFGSSIAMDLSYAYLIIPGTLRILQYQKINDSGGIPPSVQITSPTSGPLVQGATITLSANATDDVAVASVSLLVNGQPVFTSANPPYQISYVVPLVSTITFGATAVDYGNNVGAATNVTLQVIPDPLTTATGRVITRSTGVPVPGAIVSALGVSASTATDGTFSLPGVPTIQGPIVVNAIGTVAGVTVAGSSAATAPVLGGIANVGDILVGPKPLITSVKPKSVLAGTTSLPVTVTGANFTGSTFAFSPTSTILITTANIASDGTSASLLVNFPATAVGTFALIASSPSGTSDATVTQINRLTSVDPNSTADTDKDGIQDVLEAVFGTDPLDPTSFPVIPAATETESVAFSVLNAPVTGAGIIEVEGVAFSVLNAPVTGAGIIEVEGVAFSVLNAPVTGAGVVETEGVAFSVLNAPITGAGIAEAESVAFSLLNAPTSAAGILEAEGYVSVLNTFVSTKSTPAKNQATQAQVKTPPVTQPAAAPSVIDPFLDSDGDGLPDWYELLVGTDPYDPDTDGDGLSDFDELFVYHTNPLLDDTDGDGFIDGEEVIFGSDPLKPDSTPLTVRRRAAISPAVNGLAIIADDRNSSKNSNVEGDVHVNARTSKTGRTKAPALGRFLSRLVSHRDNN